MAEGTSIVPTGEADESFLQVRSWTGFSIRLIILASDGTEREMLMGRIERVVVTGALVVLEGPNRSIATGDTVSLEVFARHGLIQCQTAVQEIDQSTRIWLNFPDQFRVVQRRRHPRVDVTLKAQMRPDQNEVLQHVTILNLSAGGLALAASQSADVGTLVWLHLEVLGLAPAEIPARVVRSRCMAAAEWEMGVAFEALNPAQETKVAQYVAALLEEA